MGTITNIKLNGQTTTTNPGFSYADGIVNVTIPANSPDFQSNHK
jgi:hypothetical protein